MALKAQAPRTLMEIREIPKDSLCPEDLKGMVRTYCICDDLVEDVYLNQQMVVMVLKEEVNG
jgi:hypothetical protein